MHLHLWPIQEEGKQGIQGNLRNQGSVHNTIINIKNGKKLTSTSHLLLISQNINVNFQESLDCNCTKNSNMLKEKSDNCLFLPIFLEVLFGRIIEEV